MKLLMAPICLALSISPASMAQAVTLTIKPMEIPYRTEIFVELILRSESNSAPAGLQWKFRLPPSLQIAGIEAGQAVNKAGKTLVCNGAKCMVYGLNRSTIPNGQIAIAKIGVSRTSGGPISSALLEHQPDRHDKREEVQIVEAVATSLDGKEIKVVPSR